MQLNTLLGRAAGGLGAFASGLCLTVAASAFLFAADAQAQTPPRPPAAPAPRAAGDGPPLWVIRDADSTIYLFGTVHLLRPGAAWGSDKVDAAFDGASEVWFEIADPDDQAALMPVIQQYGVSREGPLSSRLNAEDRARLDAAVRAMGAEPAQIDPMRPWFAALMISMTPLVEAGFDAEAGVETNLRARALAAGKTIRGFETIDQQMLGLAQMSEAGQLTYLRHYLARQDDAVADLDRAVAGWAAGDLAAMADYARENGRDISEEMHQIFVARRNADWVDQIETLLKGSGTAFIAVGAAHLAGDDSVQDLLARKGVAATRL